MYSATDTVTSGDDDVLLRDPDGRVGDVDEVALISEEVGGGLLDGWVLASERRERLDTEFGHAVVRFR